MAVNITNEELDLFNKNGFTDDDVRATVENYRSQGLDDNAIRAKVQAKLDTWGTTKQPTKQTRTYPNQSVKNMAEEEFKKNVDKIYDIPQVDIPQRGKLVNSDGQEKGSWFDNLVNASEKYREEVEQKYKEVAKEKLEKREEWEKAHPIISGIQKDYQPNYRADVEQWKLDAKYGLNAPLKEALKTDLKKVGLNLVPSTNIAVDIATGGSGTVAKQGLKELVKQGAKQGAKTGVIGGLTQGVTSSLADNGISTDLLLRPLQYGTFGLLGGGLLGGVAPVAIKGVEKVVGKVAKPKVKPQTVEQPQVTKEVKAEVVEQPKVKTLTETFLEKGKGYDFEDEMAKTIKKIDSGKYTQKDFEDLNSFINEIENEALDIDNGVELVKELRNKYKNLPLEDLDTYMNRVEQFDNGYNPISKQVEPIREVPQIAQPTPEQVTGDIKKRSLQQSVLEAKGTPKEVKEIIKEDMPTYEVMHNKDLVAQATKELEGNFDNELVRLASAKDFDALDFEKSHQIARELFGMGEYQKAVDLIDNVSENATKKGQAIQALSLWSNMTPEGAVYKAQKLIKEYNKKHPKKPIELTDENVETIANLQKEALNTTDELTKKQALSKSMKYISELVPKNALQKLKAYRNIAMLLNPKTLMRNTVGNALFNTIDTASKGLASGIDTLMSLKTGKKTRVAPSLKTYGKGLVEGAKTGYKEALQGIDTRGLGQRFDLGSGRTFQSKPMRALETALDIGLRTPDRAFYEATFAESVENMMKAQGLKEPTQEILEQAEREALESVFQNQSKISDFALGLRSGINRIGTKDFGLGDVLIPYAQTPANLTQQAINYSPLGAVKGLANLAQGNQRQASLDLARSLIGSGLIGGGYGLAKAGLTTPSQFDENYQKNKTIRENLQPLGIRPDQLGDMWYAPFQPMSSPIAVGTAMANNENPLYAGLNTVVDQPYLQGVTRGLRDIQEGDWAKAGTNVLASIPSQFVPTAFSQIAQTIDPYQRETYDPNKLKYGLNSAIAKVPFASKTLPEKVDVTGQPIERYKTEGARKLSDIFLNPTFINKKTDDPVLSELKYIYDETKETSHFMPSADKKLKFKDVDGNQQEIELTGREFSEYQKRLGQRMYEEFDYVMDLPKYTNADEYGKIKLLEKAKKLVKDEVDNEMWNKKKAYKKSSYTKGN